MGLPPGALERTVRALGRRDVLARLGLGLAACVVLCLVIRAWSPPFPYRKDFTPQRDIVARVAFRVPDPNAWEQAKERAMLETPGIYEQNPQALIQLRAELQNSLLELVAAETFEQVDRDLWAAFNPPQATDAPPPDPKKEAEAFLAFRQEVAGERNLARIEKAVASALVYHERHGLLTKPHEGGNQKEIEVYQTDQPTALERIPLPDVLIGDGAGIRRHLASQLGSDALAGRLFNWLQPRLVSTSTLVFDKARTNEAQAAAAANVPEVFVPFAVGQTLAKADAPLGPEQLRLLRREYDIVEGQRPLGQKTLRAAGMMVVLLVLFGFCVLYFRRRERELAGRWRRLGLMAALAVLTVAVSRWAAHTDWPAEIVPLLLFGQILAIAYHQELALLLSGAVSAVLALGLGLGLGEIIVLLGVTATAVLQLEHVRSRSKLIYVGVYSGLVAMALTVAVALVVGQPFSWVVLEAAVRNGGFTLAAGFLMTGLLPLVERMFGVLTDISLLELGDVAHPLLQELVRRAPSTYNHSITVGSIAEAAANAIGARGLLVRVGAYFHDIGKMLKPGYFIENQGDQANRHEALVPAMSTLVIIAHIKDGANLARQHHLPEPIVDFISQHHGTTLVGYFFERAKQSRTDPTTTVDESTYRYPGPRPQTKEAAVMMLADAVESASRTLVDPTPARIDSLVREIAERRLDDGQFDESGLTLRELRTIEDSMVKSVTAIYHGRVKYPDQRTA
ncbi:MAG: HDIG domain-containing protein [Pirellulales bacterium]|nr:HDIG domain-containing protein [Pirellulales bacterium]